MRSVDPGAPFVRDVRAEELSSEWSVEMENGGHTGHVGRLSHLTVRRLAGKPVEDRDLVADV